MVALAILVRFVIYDNSGDVQSTAYHTTFGRIDQFILGIAAYRWHRFVNGRHLLAALTFALFVNLYYWFDARGGFYCAESCKSTSSIWVWLPAAEGLASAIFISWYYTSFTHRQNPISKFVSKIGEYSYSIYLLHFFVVFKIADWVNTNIIDITNFYVAFPVAIIAFIAMIPMGYVNMKVIEAPFLKLRRSYYLKTT